MIPSVRVCSLEDLRGSSEAMPWFLYDKSSCISSTLTTFTDFPLCYMRVQKLVRLDDEIYCRSESFADLDDRGELNDMDGMNSRLMSRNRHDDLEDWMNILLQSGSDKK